MTAQPAEPDEPGRELPASHPTLDWLLEDPVRWSTYLAGYQRGVEVVAGERDDASTEGFLAGFFAGYQQAHEEFTAAVYGDTPPAAVAEPYAVDPDLHAVQEVEAERWDAGEYGDRAGDDLVHHLRVGQFDGDAAGAA